MTTKAKIKAIAKKPAVRVVATNPAGKRGKLSGINPSEEVVRQTASVIPFIIKTVIVLGIGYGVYRAWSNRFVKKQEISRYGKANITDAQAEAKAEAVYASVDWFSGDFENLRDQFINLNYNAVIKVYNAFGKRTGRLLSGEVDLFEFLQQQLNASQLMQLRVLIGNTFF